MTPPKKRMRYYPAVGPAIPHTEVGCSRVTHPFAGRGLLHALDLHVLSTPPAFVLSQDQTLQENLYSSSNAVFSKRSLNKNRVRNRLTRD